MLKPTHSDVVALATHLLTIPRSKWEEVADGFITQANQADLYMLTTGLEHPEFGTGTLISAVGDAKRKKEPALDDWQYSRAWTVVLHAMQVGRNEFRKMMGARGIE